MWGPGFLRELAYHMTIGKDLGSQKLVFILGVGTRDKFHLLDGETEAQHEEETFQGLFDLPTIPTHQPHLPPFLFKAT